MKLPTLTTRFSRSEGADNGTSRRASTVPYSPVPYSLPAQGPGPALLPVNPALLEACEIALRRKPIDQDLERNPSSEQGSFPSEDPDREVILTVGSAPTPQTPGQPVTPGQIFLPRDITNLDLRSALGTYLNYLPLVGEDEEEEVCHPPPAFITMKSNKDHQALKPDDISTYNPFQEETRDLPADPTLSVRGSLVKGEYFLTGLGIDEVHSNTGMRVQSLPSQVAIGKDIAYIAEAEEESFKQSLTLPTPPIPPRNPARLLRGKAAEETVLAVSYRWQRRQNKRQQLAAGSNRRSPVGDLSSVVSAHKSTSAALSKTINEIHTEVERVCPQMMQKLNGIRDEKNEGHENTKDHNIGLGISLEKHLSTAENDNMAKEIKSTAVEGQGIRENKNNAAMGHAEERLRTLAHAIENTVEHRNHPIISRLRNSQEDDIGLGINIYGLSEPFGYGGGAVRHHDQDEEEDLDTLVQILIAAWHVEQTARAEAEALPVIQSEHGPGAKEVDEVVELTEPVVETQLAETTDPIDNVVAGGTGDEPGIPSAPEITSMASHLEATASSENHVANKVDPENIIGRTKIVDAGDTVMESTIETRSSQSVQLLWSARAGEVMPTPPLSVAIVVAESRNVGASPTSAVQVDSQLSLPTECVNNNELIDNLLETTYRGQAESFNRKHSGASKNRSLSNTSRGAAAASVRATSAPVSNPRPSRLAEGLTQGIRSLRTPSAYNKIVVKPFAVRHGGETRNQSGVSSGIQAPPASPHVTYGHRFYTLPDDKQQLSVKKKRPQPVDLPPSRRGLFYFTEGERQYIKQLVHAEPRGCAQHPNCIECYNTEYAYIENKVMPTSMPPEERNRIISNNRSLRTIKNELESLAENGAISDEQFDTIMNALPAESALSGSSRTAPVASPAPPAPPTTALNNLNISNNSSPPAYTSGAAPSLPDRNNPSKPELTRATALYRYSEAGDCNFEVGDEIAVYEYMNADWWLGKNLRTGQEGVFPVNYVQPQASPIPPTRSGPNIPGQGVYYGNDKDNTYGAGFPPHQQPYQSPPAAGPSDPYTSAAPPMQVAAQPVENRHGKGAEMGKKFGKKLGNAAIFGAGATIGSDIVNSIF